MHLKQLLFPRRRGGRYGFRSTDRRAPFRPSPRSCPFCCLSGCDLLANRFSRNRRPLGQRRFHPSHRLEKPDVAFHDITIEKVSPLSEAIGFGTHHINSYHHQAIKVLAPGFSAAAVSSDGIIESIYCKHKKYVLGVQWHPERDYHAVPDSKKILDKFIKVCSELKKV